MHCEDSSDLIAHMRRDTHIQHLCRVIKPFIELVPITLICDHADVVGDHKSCDDRGDYDYMVILVIMHECGQFW